MGKKSNSASGGGVKERVRKKLPFRHGVAKGGIKVEEHQFKYPKRSKRYRGHEPMQEDFLWAPQPFRKPLFTVRTRLFLLSMFMRLITLHGVIVCLLAMASTCLCWYFDLLCPLPLSMLSTAIIFPISFSISYTFSRRERAFVDLADLKASAVALFECFRDWGARSRRMRQRTLAQRLRASDDAASASQASSSMEDGADVMFKPTYLHSPAQYGNEMSVEELESRGTSSSRESEWDLSLTRSFESIPREHTREGVFGAGGHDESLPSSSISIIEFSSQPPSESSESAGSGKPRKSSPTSQSESEDEGKKNKSESEGRKNKSESERGDRKDDIDHSHDDSHSFESQEGLGNLAKERKEERGSGSGSEEPGEGTDVVDVAAARRRLGNKKKKIRLERPAESEKKFEEARVEDDVNQLKELLTLLFDDIREYLSHEGQPSELLTRIYRTFDDIWRLQDRLRTYDDWIRSVISRAYQYHRYLVLDFERLKIIHDYRTASTLRSYGYFFLNVYPVLLGPYFAYLGYAWCGVGCPPSCRCFGQLYIGLFSSLLTTFMLVMLFSVQEALEDPFDTFAVGALSLDVLNEVKHHLF